MSTFVVLFVIMSLFILFSNFSKVKKYSYSKTVKAPISIGELFDKISILEIKKMKIKDENKLKIIDKELSILSKIKNKLIKSCNCFAFEELYCKLYEINLKLWDVEEIFRNKDIVKEYDEKFIECARMDILLNDKRFLIKRQINNMFDSKIKEVKSYNEEILNR